MTDIKHPNTGRGWRTREGMASPLGVTWVAGEEAYNFALYSQHAEHVTLLLYSEDDPVTPLFEYRFDQVRNKSGRVWHCRIPKARIKAAQYYAYRVSGPPPAAPAEWHRFDSEKILLDPYATSVFFPSSFDRTAAASSGSTAGKAPLGLLCACESRFDWTESGRPVHESDAVIYEVHVKQFTKNRNSGVSDAAGGTYRGIVEKIPYLKDLGITAVQLMPVLQNDPQEDSHWGYMPLNFFAPDQRYAASGPLCGQHDEFKEMVRALHRADIEVVVDVVYNHTAEGDATGPVYSFRGIDNSTYYMMSRAQPGRYEDFAGTGNTFNCANRVGRRLVLDSLRHWAHDMRVDGFRFDLASVFVRNTDGSINFEDPMLAGDVTADPGLGHLRLIAEPWDAAGMYQLGKSFPAHTWLQWNGRFRDDVRRFVRGDAGLVPAIMSRVYGSADLFPRRSRTRLPSISGCELRLVSQRLYSLRSGRVQHEAQLAERASEHGRPCRRLQLELRLGGRSGRARRRIASAETAGQELLYAVVPIERNAHVSRRRRVHADAGWQQQSLQSGQRNHMARLGSVDDISGYPSLL